MEKIIKCIPRYCFIVGIYKYRLTALNYKSSSCEILVFDSVVVSLGSRHEYLKPANLRNLPEDQYPQSRH
jgi:hypothetical protein